MACQHTRMGEPLSPLLITNRQLLIGSELTHLLSFGVVSGLAVASLFTGWIIYRVAMPHIIARLSA